MRVWIIYSTIIVLIDGQQVSIFTALTTSRTFVFETRVAFIQSNQDNVRELNMYLNGCHIPLTDPSNCMERWNPKEG